jgi:hypothetical protein
VFLIGDPIAGRPYVSVISDKVVPDELRRHHKELAEYNELSEAGKAAYEEARISREAACLHQAMRIASAAAPAPTASSEQRPALRPPSTGGTTSNEQARGLSNPIGRGVKAGGVGR